MPTNGSPRGQQPRSARRREDLRRAVARPGRRFAELIQRPELVYCLFIALALVIVAGGLVAWSREQAKVGEGQVMTHSRLNRLTFQVVDEAATDANREEARKSAPRAYRLNQSYLDRLQASVDGLPKALAEKTELAQLSPELQRQFDLDSGAITVIQSYTEQGQTRAQWTRWVDNLVHDQLLSNPVIDQEEWDKFITTGNRAWSWKTPSGAEELRPVKTLTAIQLLPDPPISLEQPISKLVAQAGFPPRVARHVAARVLSDLQPTFIFDPEQTTLTAEQRFAAAPLVEVKFVKGDVIYSRGDVLSLAQLNHVRQEASHYHAKAGVTERWLPRLGAVGLIALVAMLLAGYVAVFYPRIARNVLRIAALGGLITLMLAVTVLAVEREPRLVYLAAIAPTLLVAIIALLAYDQRLALFISALQCMLVVLALEQDSGMYILLFAGCATAVVQLRDLRHRNTLIRASAVTAAVLGAGAIVLGLLEVPMVSPRAVLSQITYNAAFASAASFGVGFLVLGILPSIERLFDITTGMTLAELRDPKHPLLRLLQQKAPGTYNHSLQVANIAEAAAEAIGANGLLVYVGALYHDVGKVNKPEYFIENQAGGYNKHEKLTPAMSLLILVGHVKDGIELAKEYSLPRALHHFIESHHGTTLVEYFYHAAKTRAQSQHTAAVEEFEFRYPGPKPQTREAAILMLADVVESATRTMAEPNPGRIENLVHRLSRKRLNDGQFDRADLTFRELSLIEESIVKSVCAIYHGRISYPSERSPGAGTGAAPGSGAVPGRPELVEAAAAPLPAVVGPRQPQTPAA